MYVSIEPPELESQNSYMNIYKHMYVSHTQTHIHKYTLTERENHKSHY